MRWLNITARDNFQIHTGSSYNVDETDDDKINPHSEPIKNALEAIYVDRYACQWAFGDERMDPNPHFSADVHDMNVLS